jgi:hypothetical protein
MRPRLLLLGLKCASPGTEKMPPPTEVGVSFVG